MPGVVVSGSRRRVAVSMAGRPEETVVGEGKSGFLTLWCLLLLL
jgi:hypothetical protein